jgi:hypothetical protein
MKERNSIQARCLRAGWWAAAAGLGWADRYVSFFSVYFFSIFLFFYFVVFVSNSNLLICFAGNGFGNFYPTMQGFYLAP